MQWSRDLFLSINTSSPSMDPLFCFEINSGKFPLPPSFLASFPFPVLDKTKNQQKKLKSIYFCPFLVSIICPKRELIGFCYEKEKNKRGGRYFLCLIFYGIKLISEGRLQHQVHAYTQKNVRFCFKLFRISFPSEPSLFGVCEFLYYLPPKTNSLSPPLLVS